MYFSIFFDFKIVDRMGKEAAESDFALKVLGLRFLCATSVFSVTLWLLYRAFL